MPKNIFRAFNPKVSKEDRVEKRRAQVRQAQQTYRERKDKYTKALELDLARSRAQEAVLWRENERLQSTIRQLTEQVQIMSNSNSSLSRTAEQSKSEAATSSLLGLPYSPLSEPDSALPALPSYAQPILRLGDLDPTDLGMKFVLALEEPCLVHLHGDPDSPQESNNHALTVSAKLCNLQPSALETSLSTSEPLDYSSTPKSILEAMLSLSDVVAVPENGMTPVQAWNQIRFQPQFSSIKLLSLQALATSLRDSIKCHGFGAVVDQGVFLNLVYETLHLEEAF